MVEWAGIALDHKSGDQEALKKKNDATRLLSEQKVREEQYRSIITRAQENFKNGQWQDAKSQSEAALNLKPESAEAKKIYNQSTKKIEAAAEIEKYLTRADLFFAQKSYDEALRELKKVQSYDPENEEALNRINEIGNIRKEHDNKVAALTSQYEQAKKSSDFKTAISACEQLADLDSINQKKWSKEAEKLRSEEENFQKELKRFEDLKEKVTSAYFDEKWADVIHFAEDALQIKEDEKLRLRIVEANIKLKEKEEKEQYENGVHRVNELLLAEDFEEAETLINQLQKDFAQHKDQIKELRKRLISQQFRSPKKEKTQKPKESDTNKKAKIESDDFFGDDTKQKPKPSSHEGDTTKRGKKETVKVRPTEDDFFGSDNTPKNKSNKQTSKANQKKPAVPSKDSTPKVSSTGIDFFDS